MEDHYVILGIHGADVATVEGNVARVRFFYGDKVADEDHKLPEELPPGVTADLFGYGYLLKGVLEERLINLAKGGE